MPIFAWNVPLVSLIFLKRSLVFPILSFSSFSLHWSLRKAFSSLVVILWNSAFRWNIFIFLLGLSLLFFPRPFVRFPQTTSLHFCIYFGGNDFDHHLLSNHKPPSIDLQALYQIESLKSVCLILAVAIATQLFSVPRFYINLDCHYFPSTVCPKYLFSITHSVPLR